MEITKLATGLHWPEGPSVLDDGSIVFVQTNRGEVSRYSLERGVERFADTGGGPNATTLGSDGAVYLTQNGGTTRRQTPSIQRIDAAGRVETLVTKVEGIALQAPNDLAFGPDGRLYFTDPGRWLPEEQPDPGRVFAVAPDGRGEVLHDGPPSYPNGIAVEADGSVVWVESYTGALKRWRDGVIDHFGTLDDHDGAPDGFKVAANGDLYVTGVTSGGLHIFSPNGSLKEFIPIGHLPSNCAFGDGVLYVTDGGVIEPGATPTDGALLAVPVSVGAGPTWRGVLG